MKPQLVLHQQRWHDNDIALCYHRALWCVHTACVLVVVFFVFSLSCNILSNSSINMWHFLLFISLRRESWQWYGGGEVVMVTAADCLRHACPREPFFSLLSRHLPCLWITNESVFINFVRALNILLNHLRVYFVQFVRALTFLLNHLRVYFYTPCSTYAFLWCPNLNNAYQSNSFPSRSHGHSLSFTSP